MSSFWRTRRISVRRTLLLAGGVGFLAAEAAGAVPDWVRSAAAERLPPYPADVSAVVLLDEQVTTVREKGEIHNLYRRAYRLLSSEGRERGVVEVPFDAETRISGLRAWSVSAQGKESEAKEKDAVETGLSDAALYSDERRILLRIPGGETGSTIAYEYEHRQRSFVLQNIWWFQQDIPVRRARFRLELPPRWDVASHWRELSGAGSAGERNTVELAAYRCAKLDA